MIKIGILGSTRGTVMLSIIDAIQQKKCAAEIAIVVSNKQEALILENAKRYELKTQYLNPASLSREDYDVRLSEIMRQNGVQLVVLIGYMRILSPYFIHQWEHKIINVHPSLLPAFAGQMDGAVHQAVIDSKANESGCTVHIVTEAVDAGPIIIQKKCSVGKTDTAESLKKRVQQLEGEAMIAAIQSLYEQN